ncbi:VOC family protein [Hoeflea prorocentri]|uniref:VOC family protein n=1 Tax=Hoeflea prorocentri TaxID=1922333 RepID=A0A9X3ZG27_9HYPH|nr:VOC family protein [Hoeflea prorocentri]MCY6379754.1 VOC family protein [Hoeflea prorocentri]MDA5397554.1 VOC family protein [Hoeflea prorocentri]
MSDDPRVGHLRGIVMRAPGITATTNFYTENWGLHVSHEEDGMTYLRGSGSEPFIYGLKDDDVYGIEYVHFGMPDRSSVDAIHARLVEMGAKLLSAPAELDGPFGGYGFELLDPDGRRLRITSDLQMRAPEKVHAFPHKVSHVVLNTPDLEATQKWYEDMLGFRTSDYSADQMIFLRCGSDHHAIALVRAQYPSVNHVAFEMPGIDSFMRGIGRMKQKGQAPSWGPGRHGPGNNPFAYFVSPSGYVIEFTADVQQIDEATHEPKVWSRTDPEAMDQWMTAGPPTPAQRAVMAGRPDPGFSAGG